MSNALDTFFVFFVPARCCRCSSGPVPRVYVRSSGFAHSTNSHLDQLLLARIIVIECISVWDHGINLESARIR